MNDLDGWLRSRLVCPQDKRSLSESGGRLVCEDGHGYSVVDGIPVMLFDDGSPTHGYITKTLDQVKRIASGERPEDVIWTPKNADAEVDEFVQAEIPYTCGNLYFSIQHKLTRYPFPDLRLPAGDGKRLLDVGCNWGRWTLPAAKLGYMPVGIDPCLDAVMAARRISRQLGLKADFLVADARYLPFAEDSFDTAFSNGVLQHLKKVNVKAALKEMARVTKVGGRILVQMPNKYGLRCIYRQVKNGFREGEEGGGVMYWTPSELIETFSNCFGETDLSADCYFGLNNQRADIDLMPARFRAVIQTSEFFRSLSSTVPGLAKFADSVYLLSKNRKNLVAA